MRTPVPAVRNALASDERVQGLTLSEKMSLLYVACVPFDGTDVGGRSLPFIVGAVGEIGIALVTLGIVVAIQPWLPV